MFDHRHCHQDRWAAGRHHRRGRFGRHGFGGRHGRDGMDNDDMMRAGRLLAQGDLRLIALALIAEQPRHGYEIIKLIEEKTADWYSPSPGIVYPTLTYLEELGYVTAQADGAKKLYTITDDGQAYLTGNRELANAVLERLTAIGERAARWRRRAERDRSERDDDDDRRRVPPLVKAALDNLREAAAARLASDAEAEARVVELLARVALDLRRH
jgi:DNA-binding PadR family transcriptional regulator